MLKLEFTDFSVTNSHIIQTFKISTIYIIVTSFEFSSVYPEMDFLSISTLGGFDANQALQIEKMVFGLKPLRD